MNNEGLKHIVSQALRNVLGNMVVASAGLAIGSSSKAKVLIANTVEYLIDSVFYSKTTAEIAFTDLTSQGPSLYCKYMLSVNAAGTAVITNGNQAATAAAALLPDTPDGYQCIGYAQVATDASTTFVPATTLLDASGLTVTYVNLSRNTAY